MRKCIRSFVKGILLVGLICITFYAVALPEQAWVGPADQVGGEMAAVVGGEVVYLAQGRRILAMAEDDEGDLALVHTSDMFGGAVTALGRVGEFLVAGWRSADGRGNLSWFSLNDSRHPEWVRDFVYEEMGLPTDLVVMGETLYVMDHFHEVIPVDVGDPLAPEVHPSIELTRVPYINKLAAIHDDKYLLVASQPAVGPGLTVFVLSLESPLAPEHVSHYGVTTWAGDTSFVVGSDYMVLLKSSGPEIVSLADPTEPELLSQISFDFNVAERSAFLHQDHLIFGVDEQIVTWDLSDSENPEQVSSVGAPVIGARHIVEGASPSEAVIVDPIGRAVHVDLADVSNPVTLSTLELPFGSAIRNVVSVPSGFAVLDATHWLNRILLYTDQMELTDLWDPGWISVEVSNMAARDDGIIMVSDGEGVQVIDLADPRPEGVSEFIDLKRAAVIEMHEDRAWVVGDGILHELDLSVPLQPSITYELESEELTPIWAGLDAMFFEGHLYVLTGDRVLIYRVDEDSEPVQVGQYDGCRPRAFSKWESLAAVMCVPGPEEGVHFLDVSDPASPEFLSQYTDPGLRNNKSVHLEADHAWIGGSGTGVYLIDVHDPRTPFQLARFHVDNQALAIIPVDNGVWVAANTGGVTRLEAPDPITPGQTAAWYDPERAGEGWVVEVLGDDQVLGYWYTYDDEGNPRWLIGTGTRRDNRVVLEMEEAAGGRFGDEFDPDEVAFSAAGTVRMKFTGCDVGWFHYEFEDDSLDIGLDRLTRTLELGECRLDQQPFSQAPANHSGSWYDPAWAGQGFSVHRLGNGLAMVYWFTFDAEGEPYWIFGVGEDDDGRIVIDELTAARGASFGEEFDPDDVEMFAWGELEMELDCLTGTAEYRSDIDQFGSGRFELERLTIPAGLSCD